MKHLIRNLKINREQSIETLNENQWGIIFKTMDQYVPHHFWPRLNKKKLDHFKNS